MFGRIIPREGRFFDLFTETASLCVEAAYEFKKLILDLKNAESHSRNIKVLEHKADETTHRTIELLHKTFITPIDREDIHQLTKEMDDIIDFIEAASQRIILYDVKSVTNETIQLADVCIASAEAVKKAVLGLSNLKHPEDLIKDCVEINRLENEADHIMRSAMAKLFREESDIKQLIKLKDIYELLETVTDRCEDVANTIEGIVLESS